MRTGKAVARDGFPRRARREQLLECTVAALSEVGYAGTSIGEVARRAGVSKGVVTYHFATREELLMHVVTELYARGGDEIGRRVAAAAGPREALLAYLDQNLAFVATHAAHVRAALEVMANAGHLRRDRAAAGPAAGDPLVGHLRDLIVAVQRAGDLPGLDPTAAAVIIRSAIDAAAARGATDDDFDRAAYLRTLTAMVTGTGGQEVR